MFALYAVPGVVWALWFMRWLRDHPAGHPDVNAAELQLIHPGIGSEVPATLATHPSVPWRLLVSSPAIWWICAQQFCRAAGYIFFSSWFATYLQEARGVTIIGSGLLTMLPLMGDVTGSLLGGALSDAVLHRTGNQRFARQGLTIIAMLLCASLILVASFSTNALAVVLIISTGMFCADHRQSLRQRHRDEHERRARGHGRRHDEHVRQSRCGAVSTRRAVAAAHHGKLERRCCSALARSTSPPPRAGGC